nr:MAG TPA: hypothetical protein [Caudoviricetes sp.]
MIIRQLRKQPLVSYAFFALKKTFTYTLLHGIYSYCVSYV